MSITSLTTGEPTPLGRPWGLGVGGTPSPPSPLGLCKSCSGEVGAGGSSPGFCSPLLRSEPSNDPTSLEFEEFPAKALWKTRERKKTQSLTLSSPRLPHSE